MQNSEKKVADGYDGNEALRRLNVCLDYLSDEEKINVFNRSKYAWYQHEVGAQKQWKEKGWLPQRARHRMARALNISPDFFVFDEITNDHLRKAVLKAEELSCGIVSVSDVIDLSKRIPPDIKQNPGVDSHSNVSQQSNSDSSAFSTDDFAPSPLLSSINSPVAHSPSHVIRIPMMANPIPSGFVERSDEFTALKAALLEVDGSPEAISTALVGTGGFGKTWLATAICHDPAIQKRFHDGILWVTLGEKPQDLLSKVGGLIYALTHENAPIGIDAARFRLKELLHEKKNILLIIDDVWQIEALKTFLEGGDKTVRRLIITRNRKVLPQGTRLVVVDAMQPDGAHNVLVADLPKKQVKSCENDLHAMAQQLGYWPLLLALANGFLNERVKDGKDNLSQAIADAWLAWRESGPTAFDSESEDDCDRAIGVCIGLSLNQLGGLRDSFLDLAIFPEDLEIPVATVAMLWKVRGRLAGHQSRNLLSRLNSLSLLQSLDLGKGVVTLHDVIRSHLRKLHKSKLVEAHMAFLDSFRVTSSDNLFLDELDSCQYSQKHHFCNISLSMDIENKKEELQYIWHYVKYHLQHAGKIDEWFDMLLNIEFLAKRTKVLGSTTETLADMEECANTNLDNTIAQSLSWYYGQSAHLLLGCETWQEIGRLLIQRLWLVLKENGLQKVAKLNDYLPLLVPIQSPPDHPSLENLERQMIEGHGGWVLSCLQLKDGRFVSTSTDKTIKLWSWLDGANPQVTSTLKGHGGKVNACAELPGNQLVTASDDKTLILWDLTDGSRKTTIYHSQGVNDCIVLNDGRVVAACDDSKVYVWNLNDIASSFTLDQDGHSEGVTACVEFDSGKLLTASRDKTLKIWDLNKKEMLKTMQGEHNKSVTGCAVLPDGKIVSTSEDGFLVLWDNYIKLQRIKAHKGKITSCAVANGLIITTGDDKTCKMWDQTTVKIIRSFSGHLGEVMCSTVLEGGQILTGSEDKNLKLWDPKSGRVITTFSGRLNGAQDVAVLKDGRVISANETGNLDVWSERGDHLFALPVHKNWLWGCVELPDNRVATCSTDKTCKTLFLGDEQQNCQEMFTLKGHTDAIWGLSLLAENSKRIITGSEDGTFKVWDIDTGEELKNIEAHEEGICDCTASNGRPVTGSYDHTVKIWEIDPVSGLPTGNCIILNHKDEVWCCKSLPDGRIFSGSKDKTLVLWSTDGEKLCQLEGHKGYVNGCAASKNVIPLLASASEDGTFKVWDFDPATNLPNPKALATYYAEGQINYCFIYPDNKRFVVAGGNGVYFLKLIELEEDVE